MSGKKFKSWLFDLDGTLADTAQDLTLALNHVLELNNKPPVNYQTVRPYAAFGSKRLIKLGFGDKSDVDGRLKNTLLDYYEVNVAKKTRLFPGMGKVLNKLEKNKIMWGVVTNKPARFTLPLLKALNVYDKARVVISGDTCKNSKPNPEPILYACSQLAIKPCDTLYIGDSGVDLEACHQARVRMVLAEYGYLQQDDKIETWNIYGSVKHPEELLSFI